MTNSMGEWDDEEETSYAPASELAEDQVAEAELFYPNVVAFVSEKLATTYRRQINVQGGTTWCPQWWKHAEAISRLESLWRAWEYLRLDGTTGMSVWWRDHADHHMSMLLSADGPFKGCTPDDGHRTKLAALPCEDPPTGLFD
ncbi:DUF4913 domain-containing protein [Paenarthrobacter ureafaciens]|uniref:DUF4913 domain-containing protein n=1 Tax=Paenarthrobacter ureafaciens TaxID=37931 RepID=UPI001FB48051|nr:DUF4913 domain-containing protein [Paenarthrobacter ureafaciens]UOD83454.1 DUF4913 domain-containing protein [Paenarthrobacter ureafaciens]WNZ02958.1 DUF4913 domain-containing protein [Paenarthrobacter ureafaciens]